MVLSCEQKTRNDVSDVGKELPVYVSFNQIRRVKKDTNKLSRSSSGPPVTPSYYENSIRRVGPSWLFQGKRSLQKDDATCEKAGTRNICPL